MMKTGLTLVLGFVFSCSVVAGSTPWDKPLPFQAATIQYQLSGTMSGQKTIYIKDYGASTAEISESSMTIFGMVQKQKELIVTTPEWQYSVDFVSNSGTKQANPNKYLIEAFQQLSSAQQKTVRSNLDKLGVSTVEGLSGQVEKNVETILGYPCDRVQMMGTTAYTLSGSDIPMKVEGKMMGIAVNEEAVSIDVGRVADSKFALPSNIRFEHHAEVDRMLQQQAPIIIQSLLEGRSPSMMPAAGMMPGDAGERNLEPGLETESSPDFEMSPDQQQQMRDLLKVFGGQ